MPDLGGGTRPVVVLGVRPEDFSVTAAGAGLLDAPVHAFELTGEAMLVTVTMLGWHLSARGDQNQRWAIGDTFGIGFDTTRTYLFDAVTE